MGYDSHGTLNKVMLIGRLGQSPELKFTKNNTPVLTLSLATNQSVKDGDGWRDVTTWHTVIVWQKLAENIAKYVKKGNRIYVDGKLSVRTYTDKENVKRTVTEIVADAIQLLESKPTESNPGPEYHAPEPPTIDEDDLPF